MSFLHGPEIDGKDCELHQIENLLGIDLSPFTLRNYSGMWNESDFPPDHIEDLLRKQLEEDEIWNDLSGFLTLIKFLLTALEFKTLDSHRLSHEFEWWKGYFDFESRDNGKDSFYNDLKTIEKFLLDPMQKGESKTAFYVQ